MIRSQKNNGFTLVELAIALMVIGLLIGGVLKGQELIENARVTRTVKDVTDYDTAVFIFRNTYDAIPGDIKKISRIPNCGAPYCNLASTQRGDKKLNTIPEIRSFWIHLERVGLVSGINEQEDRYSVSPVNAFGGYFVPNYSSAETPATAEHPMVNNFRIGDRASGGANSDTLESCTRIQQIDTKMDDGMPIKGRVKIYTNTAACIDVDTGEYTNSQTRTYVRVESSAMN